MYREEEERYAAFFIFNRYDGAAYQQHHCCFSHNSLPQKGIYALFWLQVSFLFYFPGAITSFTAL